MKKIVIANSKGGSGKSTLAIAFADVLNEVQLIDMDNQGSLSSASLITGRHTPVNIKEASAKHLIFDTPPYLSEELPGLLKEADIILIPTRVGQYDLLALQGIIDRIKDCNKTKSSFIILSQVHRPKTKTYLRTRDFFFSNYKDIKKAKTEISHLMAYHTLPEKPIWGKAKKEIISLIEELGI